MSLLKLCSALYFGLFSKPSFATKLKNIETYFLFVTKTCNVIISYACNTFSWLKVRTLFLQKGCQKDFNIIANHLNVRTILLYCDIVIHTLGLLLLVF